MKSTKYSIINIKKHIVKQTGQRGYVLGTLSAHFIVEAFFYLNTSCTDFRQYLTLLFFYLFINLIEALCI